MKIFYVEEPEEVVPLDPQCADCGNIPVLNVGDMCTRCYQHAQAPKLFPEGSQPIDLADLRARRR